MASITKGVSLPRVNPIGLKGVGIVLLVVVAFTVIPELINLGSAKPAKDQSASAKVAVTSEKIVQEQPIENNGVETVNTDQVDQAASVQPVSEEKVAGQDTLARISALLDQGYLDRRRDQKIKEMMAERPEGVEVPASESGDVSPKVVTPVQPNRAGLVDASTLTWKLVKSDPLKKKIRTAQKEAAALAKTVDPKKRLTRMALLDYVTGLANLMQHGEGIIAPEDVPSYISRLERDVAGAMYSEKVEREVLAKYSKLVVAPIFSGVGISNQRPSVPEAPAFDPQLTIVSAQVTQRAGKRGVYDPAGKAVAKLQGYVIGKDIKQISIIKNGLFFKVVKPGKPDSVLNQRQFKLSNLDARARYDFVVEDKNGREFNKTYTFLEPAREFRWRHKGPTGQDQYQIPFIEGDRRFDLLFASHRPRSNSGGFGNIEFGRIDGMVAF